MDQILQMYIYPVIVRNFDKELYTIFSNILTIDICGKKHAYVSLFWSVNI